MENNFKRFLSLVVAFVMVFGMIPMNVFATEAEATLTNDDYVAQIKADLLAGNDVVLEQDVTITDYSYVNALKLPSNGNGKYNEVHGNGAVFHVTKPGVVLDLNGHTITWDAHDDAYCNARQVSLFMVTVTGNEGETADLTVKDSVGTGKVDVYGMGTGMYVVCDGAVGTITGGTWTNYPCKTCNASNIFLYPSHGGDMYITGGTFEQKESAYLLGMNGSSEPTDNNGVGVDQDETEIFISGGTYVGFNPEEVKFFDTANGSQESTINGVVEGKTAVEIAENIWSLDPVAEVNGTEYMTLKDAVAAANAIEGGATVNMLADVTLGEKLTISGNVTIEGNYTITRADNYTGTLFTVPAGAALTLDGGLTIDGGNNYAFDKDAYEADLADWSNYTDTTVADKWFTTEEGAPNATAAMISTSGTVNLNAVTIQNHYSYKLNYNDSRGYWTTGSGIVSAAAGATVTLTGATVTHCANAGGSGVVVDASGAGINIIMNEGTVIDGNHVGGNHGIFKVYSGAVLTMNGGEIKNNTGWNSNGVVVGLYSGTFNMKGGTICGNSSEYGNSNGRNAAIYLHSNSVMNMSGGTICHNSGRSRGGIDSSKSSSTLNITGGNVIHNESIAGNSTYDVGGTVGTWAITGGTYTQDVAEWVPEGYGVAIEVVEENGEEVIYYTVTDQIVKLERTGEIYHSIREAIKYAQDGDTLTVLCSHRIDNESVVLDKDVTIDLGGKTIYGWGTLNPVFRVLADVTITGEGRMDTRKFADSYGFILGSSDGTVEGNLTINGGTYLSDISVASVTKGTLNITGGQFAVTPYEESYAYTLNCIDANYKDGSAKINVTGGTFYMFDPDNNLAEGEGTDFVPDTHYSNEDKENYWTVYATPVITVTFDDQTMVLGNEMPEFTYTISGVIEGDEVMVVVPNVEIDVTAPGEYEISSEAYVFMNDKYEVKVIPGKLTVKDAVAESNGVYYASIQDAINASKKVPSTVTVLKDHTVDVNTRSYGYPILLNGHDITLDLNGKVVTFDYEVKTGSDVAASIYLANRAKLKVLDSSDEHTGKLYNKFKTSGSPRIIWVATGCKAEIVNGIFETEQMDTMFYVSSFTNGVTSELYISDGLFLQHGTEDVGNTYDCFNVYDGGPVEIIELTGGTYTCDPRTGFQNDWEVTIPEGYTVIHNGDGDASGDNINDGTWSIRPYVTVKFDDLEVNLGDDVGEATYTVDYGYLGEEVVNVHVTPDAISTYKVGEFEITGTVTLSDGTGKAENYAVKVIPGKLTVKADYIAYNVQDNEYFMDLSDALDVANSGETVQLLKTWYEELVLVPAGVTFDLNGNVVKADNVLSFGIVMDSQPEVGGIKIDIDTTKAFTKLQPENDGYLPIYDTRDGMYKFFAYDVEANTITTPSSTSVTFWSRVVFTNNAGYEVLANTENSGIDFILTMNWTGMNGFQIRYCMSDASVKEYAQLAYNLVKAGNVNKKAITATIGGVDRLGAGAYISAAPSIETVAEVTDSAAALIYNIS